jgi:hypothetical protein
MLDIEADELEAFFLAYESGLHAEVFAQCTRAAQYRLPWMGRQYTPETAAQAQALLEDERAGPCRWRRGRGRSRVRHRVTPMTPHSPGLWGWDSQQTHERKSDEHAIYREYDIDPCSVSL